MEPRLTPAELRQRMLRRLSTPDPGQTAEKVPWRLVVMDRAARAFVASLPCHELDVVEIGGRAWSDPGFGFRSYRSLSSPPWDLSREPAEPESCSLAILDQGLERARHPRQALAKVLAMLRHHFSSTPQYITKVRCAAACPTASSVAALKANAKSMRRVVSDMVASPGMRNGRWPLPIRSGSALGSPYRRTMERESRGEQPPAG